MDFIIFAPTRHLSFINKINLLGNEILCPVDSDYLLDERNHAGISKQVPNMKASLCCIFGVVLNNLDIDDAMDDDCVTSEEAEKSARIFYTLLHSRYIQTEVGMNQIVCSILCNQNEYS